MKESTRFRGENALYKIYIADPDRWNVIHRDAYDAAGDALYDGGK